jgi:CubicO group peptidase (beta-lactamase class C family)
MIMTTCYTLLLAVIHVVSGKSWGDFVEERIMEPLEMNHSAASFVRLKDSTNITPHVPINGKLKVIKRYQNQLLMQLLEFIPV